MIQGLTICLSNINNVGCNFTSIICNIINSCLTSSFNDWFQHWQKKDTFILDVLGSFFFCFCFCFFLVFTCFSLMFCMVCACMHFFIYAYVINKHIQTLFYCCFCFLFFFFVFFVCLFGLIYHILNDTALVIANNHNCL